MGKIWHKPLHKRKVWKTMSLYGKTVYYLRPFVFHIIDTWQQPLPFPTIFKILYSCFLIILILLPLILPVLIIISYYAAIQYLLERYIQSVGIAKVHTYVVLSHVIFFFLSSLDLVYPQKLDIVRYTMQAFSFEIKNEMYIESFNLYMAQWRYTTAALASCIDYIRLALHLLTN